MKCTCLLICIGCLDICGSLGGPINKLKSLSSRFETYSDSLTIPSSLADQEAKLLLNNRRYHDLTQQRGNLRCGRCAAQGRTASKTGKRSGIYYKHKGHIERYQVPHNNADSPDQYEPGAFPSAKISHNCRRHRSHHRRNINPKHYKQYQDDYEQYPVAVNFIEPQVTSNVANQNAAVEVEEAEFAEPDYEPLDDVDYVENCQHENNAQHSDTIIRELPAPAVYTGKQRSDTYYNQDEAVEPVYEQNDVSSYDERYHNAKRAFPAGIGFMHREIPVAASHAEIQIENSHKEEGDVEPDYDQVESDYEAQYQGANRVHPSVYKHKTAPVSALHAGRRRSDDDDDPNYYQNTAYANNERYQNSNRGFTDAMYNKVPGSVSFDDRYNADSYYQQEEAVAPEYTQTIASDYNERHHDANRELSAVSNFSKAPATAPYSERNKGGAYYTQKVAAEQEVEKIDDVDHDIHCYNAKGTIPSVPVYSKMPVDTLYDRQRANVSAHGPVYSLTNYNKAPSSGCDDHNQDTNEALPKVSENNKVSLVPSYVDKKMVSAGAASPGHVQGNFTAYAEKSIPQENLVSCKSTCGASIGNLVALTRNQPDAYTAAHTERSLIANEELPAVPLTNDIPRASFHDDGRATDFEAQEEVFTRHPNREHASYSSDQTNESGRIYSEYAGNNRNPIAPPSAHKYTSNIEVKEKGVGAQDRQQGFISSYADKFQNFQNAGIKLPVLTMNNGITHAGAASNGKSNAFGDVRDKTIAVKGNKQDNIATYADMSHDADEQKLATTMISDISRTSYLKGNNNANTRAQDEYVAPDSEQESSADYVEQPHSVVRTHYGNVNGIPLSSFAGGGGDIVNVNYKGDDDVAENQEEHISDYAGPSQHFVRKYPAIINTNGIPKYSSQDGDNIVNVNYKVGAPEYQKKRRASVYAEQPQNVIRELPVITNLNYNPHVSLSDCDHIVDVNCKREEVIAENQEEEHSSDYDEQSQHFISVLPELATAKEISHVSFPDYEDISDVELKLGNGYSNTQEQGNAQDYSEDSHNVFRVPVLLATANAGKIPQYLSHDGGSRTDDDYKEEDGAALEEQEHSLDYSEQAHNAARQFYTGGNANEVPQSYCDEDNNIEDVNYQEQNVNELDQKSEIANKYEAESQKDVRAVREIAKEIKIPQNVSPAEFTVENTKVLGERLFSGDRELEHVANNAEHSPDNTNEFQNAVMYSAIPDVSNSECGNSVNVDATEYEAIAPIQQQDNTAYCAQSYPNAFVSVSKDVLSWIPREDPDYGTAAEIDVPVEEGIASDQRQDTGVLFTDKDQDAFGALPEAINDNETPCSAALFKENAGDANIQEGEAVLVDNDPSISSGYRYEDVFGALPSVAMNGEIPRAKRVKRF